MEDDFAKAADVKEWFMRLTEGGKDGETETD